VARLSVQPGSPQCCVMRTLTTTGAEAARTRSPTRCQGVPGLYCVKVASMPRVFTAYYRNGTSLEDQPGGAGPWLLFEAETGDFFGSSQGRPKQCRLFPLPLRLSVNSGIKDRCANRDSWTKCPRRFICDAERSAPNRAAQK